MDKRIENILNYIEDHLFEKLKLNDLAKLACISPSQFHRIFKKETKKTPFKFIEEIKLNKAYELLIESDLLVYNLAEELGYNDYETFSRAFKKSFHISPDDLRSIADKVRTDVGLKKTDQLFIITSENEKEEALVSEIRNILEVNKITSKDLKEAKIFRIEKKSINTSNNKNLIKNKYQITRNKRIWKTILGEE